MQIHYLAILAAGVAGFLVGGAWYGVLGKHWMAALGWDPSGPRQMPTVPMIIAFVANLVMATLLSGLATHLELQFPDRPHAEIAVMCGMLVWLGFTLMPLVVNNAFAKRKTMLTVIDAGHWLAVLVVMGVVLGLLS